MSTLDAAHGHILDADNDIEKIRFLFQNQLVNQAMGEPFPEQSVKYMVKVRNVLDLGCDTAEWAMAAANAHQQIHIIGADVDQARVAIASERTRLQGMANVRVTLLNSLQGKLLFADEQFELVNVRNAVSCVPQEQWPNFLEECLRITRPAGIIRVTESDIMGITNSLAYEEHQRLITTAMHRRAYGFSPKGDTLGITPVLRKLLHQAGYEDIQLYPYALDFSYGSPLYIGYVQHILTVFKTSHPLLIKTGVASQEQLDRLYAEARKQLESPAFRGIHYFLTAWGLKPQ